MRRCKHFISLMKGTGYVSGMSNSVRGFMDKIFRVEADKRATIEQLRQDEWLLAPKLHNSVLHKLMDEKVRAAFQAQGKAELLDILTEIQSEHATRPALPRSPPSARHGEHFTFKPGNRESHSGKTSPTNEPSHCLSPKDNPHAQAQELAVEAESCDPFRGANLDVSLLTISEEPVSRNLCDRRAMCPHVSLNRLNDGSMSLNRASERYVGSVNRASKRWEEPVVNRGFEKRGGGDPRLNRAINRVIHRRPTSFMRKRRLRARTESTRWCGGVETREEGGCTIGEENEENEDEEASID
jgi:hypothetical protein